MYQVESKNTKTIEPFQTWVRNLAVTLSETQDTLSLQKAAQTEDIPLLQDHFDSASQQLINTVKQSIAELGDFVENLDNESHELYRAIFRAHLLPYLLQSPFMGRAYNKPLGYPGDYILMDMLYKQIPQGESRFAQALDFYVLREPTALAVTNRPAYLMQQIKHMVTNTSHETVEIANIACGPAQELYELFLEASLTEKPVEITLLELDASALAYCQERLLPLTNPTTQLHFAHESVKALFDRDQAHNILGHKDLIYSSGLFDYFHDESFMLLVEVLYDTLRDGGMLIIGNISPYNPSRWLMEYVLDWFVVHRTDTDLKRLAAALTPSPKSILVETEAQGIIHFLVIQK